MKPKKTYKVLFLCTGNSARSIMAEYILRLRGKGRFETYSAGSTPAGKVNPMAIEVLEKAFAIDARDARSKSWDEFRNIEFDFVITVCDNARESCPVWPGQPIVAHWGSPDPVLFEGTHEKKFQHFRDVGSQINSRIGIFCAFRDEQLDKMHVAQVGQKFKI